MSFTKSPLVLALALSAAACTSGAPAHTGGAGTSGAAGQASGTAGATGTAGETTGVAGASGTAGEAAGTAGTTGSGGATSGTAGATRSACATGVAGAAGATDGGTDAVSSNDAGAPYHRFVCPAGPYPAQMQGTTTNVCNGGGFMYNYAYNEGPTWIASQNAFFFSNFVQGDTSANKSAGDIIKVALAADGSATCSVWLHDVGCNGLGVASDGNLLGACHGPRAVMKYDVVTKEGTMVATMAGGKMLDAPNDLISTSNGNIYFSNTTYELGGRPQGLGFALVRIDPTGMTSVVQAGNLNGMALSPDEKTLYVVGMGVWMLNDDGSPGMKTGQAGPGGDGISMDCAGHILNVGTNSAFGGPDGKTLIAVGGGTAAKLIQMTVPGFP